jgi:antitoxin ParD1/3/4
MNISLTTEQEIFIQTQITNGSYLSADEVIDEALRLLEEHQRQLKENILTELRQKLTLGAEQISKGQVTDGDSVFEQIFQKINQISEEQQ